MRPIMNPMRAALVYAFFGALWILASDTIVDDLFQDVHSAVVAQTLKGLLYVGVTTLLVYVLARRATHECERDLGWYRSLFSKSPDAVFIVGPDGRYIEVNEVAVERYGYSRSELLRMGPEDLCPPEMRKEAAARIKEIASEPRVFEWRHVAKDGREIPVEISSRSIRIAGLTCLQSTVRDLSSVKRIEQELRASQERLAHAVAAANDGLYDWNMVTGETYISPRCFTMLGYEDGEFVPTLEKWMELLHPDDHAAALEKIRKHQEEGLDAHTMEFRMRAKDGTWKWILARGHVVERDERGAPLRMVGTHADITKRREAENALRDRESLLQKVFDILPIGLWFADEKGQLLRGNAAGVAIWGGEPHVGLEDYGVFKAWRLPSLEEVTPEGWALAKTIRDGVTITDELLEIQTFDGRRKTILNYSAPVMNEEGVVKGAVVVNQDVTERMRAEERLRMMAQMLDTAPNWITVHDFDGNFFYANQKTFDIHGYEPEEFLALNLRQVDTPESAALIQQRMALLLEKGEASFEVEHIRKDGSRLPMQMYVKKVEWRGKPALLSIGTDISERLLAEKQRDQLESQLLQAQKMESVGRLAGGVAHDFNNMIGVILGNAEMSLNALEPEHPVYGNIQEILKAGRRSADLTRQLLAFARKQTIAPRVLDLNDTVAGMLKMLRRLIGEDIDLLWKPGKQVWPIKMDPAQLDQVLANLVVNARDAIVNVGKITIESSNARFDREYCARHPGFVAGEYVMLAVSDDGCGMDKETLENVFEPFFTTKAQGEGTGLGLSTVYGVVKQNEGFINVYSEPGEGTTFRIYLPRLPVDEEQREEQAKIADVAAGNETVLLVEDEEPLLKLTTRLLESLGYKVVPVEAPQKAIRLVSENPDAIDLLMTDIVMPEMNGRDLWHRLQEFRPGLKCLFMSGYTASVIAHRGILDSDVHFLQKPFSLRELASKLRETIES